MIEETLHRLIDDLEYDGYLIGLTEDGTGYWLKMPYDPVPDDCALVRFNDAKRKNPDLHAALLPFLAKHRPYHVFSDRFSKLPPRPGVIA